jgi:DNA-binding beta-propeller fold protein YncE
MKGRRRASTHFGVWRYGALGLLLAGVLLASAAPASGAITRTNYWGGDGSGDGQLHFPAFNAVDHTGNVYVADQHNSRVVKYSPQGQFLLTWGWGVKNGQPRLQTCTSDCQTGLIGSGPGQFDGGYGVAVHADRVYVTDPANDRVEVFTPTGRLKNIFGRSGSDNGELYNPHGIAIDDDGRVYVADTANNRIVKFSAGGKHLATWGSLGRGDRNFWSPWGLATDDDGHLYITDYNNDRVEKYTSGGKFLRTWGWGVKTGLHRFEICTSHCHKGQPGSGAGQMSAPEGIAVDSTGEVYVVDPSPQRIERFSPGGHYLGQFKTGRFFENPGGIAIDRFDRIRIVYSRGYVVTFAET